MPSARSGSAAGPAVSVDPQLAGPPAAGAAASAQSPGATPMPPLEEQGFDQVLDRLRQVVQHLEQGSLSLEQSLHAFEEGVRLSRRGSAILDTAEQRVELLIRDEGGERRQPLPGAPAATQRTGEREA